MQRKAFATIVLAAALLALPYPTWADDERPGLMVTAAGGQSTFRMGERIPLDLNFTGPAGEQFQITTASYDRSGRISYEEFEVEPKSGWSDPLAVYFGSRDLIMGGGLSGSKLLSPKPAVIHLNLNEWVRFDQPGNYTVRITSHRVASHPSGLAVTSNPVTLQIVPATAAWQDAKLAAIVDELKAHPATAGKAAIEDLRYLGTPAAAQVMAQHLRDDEPTMTYDCSFGLMGLPEALHPKAIAAMNKLISEPSFPVSLWFLTTLTILQIAPDKPEKELADQHRLIQANREFIFGALAGKKGDAKSETAQTLLNGHPLEFTPSMKAELGRILKESLAGMPINQQQAVLQFRWDLIQSPVLLPVLKQLARKPLNNPGSNESSAYQTRELKSIALERWYQLDPDGARQEVLHQIGSSHPSISADSLHFLGEEHLPEFENIWADALSQTTDYEQEQVLTALLAHYGTGGALGALRDKLESQVGKWACAPQGAALAYLVKFDPTSARPLVERAIQARGPGKSGCNHSTFQDISRYTHDSMLREVAVEALNDPDPEVTLDALKYLASYGEPSDQKPISDRYDQWVEQWRGHADELEPDKDWRQPALEESLIRALIENQGWLASEQLIQSTLDRCIGEQRCHSLKAELAFAQAKPYRLLVHKSAGIAIYRIAQYVPKSLELLDAKIAQFPKGARFAMEGQMEGEEQQQLGRRVKDLLEKNGMIVEPAARAGDLF